MSSKCGRESQPWLGVRIPHGGRAEPHGPGSMVVTADTGDVCCAVWGSEDILCRMLAMLAGGEVGIILAILAGVCVCCVRVGG